MPGADHSTVNKRVMMLGTFGLRPKGTMSARAVGIGTALQANGWLARLATVPWDSPGDAGRRGVLDGIEYLNTRAVRPALFPLSVRELVRETRSFQPAIVHLFKPKGFGDFAARVLRRSGLPIVVDMDDWEGYGGWNDLLPYPRAQKALFDWQERSWPARASAVTTASRTLYHRALELGADEDRVFYVPNGITRQRYQELSQPESCASPAPPGIRASDSNILLYTRFVEFDPSFVVDVLVDVGRRLPNARVIVAGGSPDGTAEDRMLRAACRAGIADRIDRLGWIDPRSLRGLAERCGAALVPFEDIWLNRAKCSVKLVELMACGIPVVASNVGENREYLGHGRYGWLARPGDAESHASALVDALTSRGADNRPFLAARRVAEHYVWDSLVPTILAAYQYAVTDESGAAH